MATDIHGRSCDFNDRKYNKIVTLWQEEGILPSVDDLQVKNCHGWTVAHHLCDLDVKFYLNYKGSDARLQVLQIKTCTGWSVAHNLAQKHNVIFEDDDVLKICSDAGLYVAHIVAHNGGVFSSRDLLELKSYGGEGSLTAYIIALTHELSTTDPMQHFRFADGGVWFNDHFYVNNTLII